MDVPAAVVMAIHPRLSPPTEYELLALFMGTFVSTAPLLLTSSRPTTRSMCPAPSASTVPPSVPAPPEVATVWLYAGPCVPAGSEVVVTDGGGVTLMVTDADVVESAAEVAVTVAVPALPDMGAL